MPSPKVTVGQLLERLRGTLQLEEIEPGTGHDRPVGNRLGANKGLPQRQESGHAGRIVDRPIENIMAGSRRVPAQMIPVRGIHDIFAAPAAARQLRNDVRRGELADVVMQRRIGLRTQRNRLEPRAGRSGQRTRAVSRRLTGGPGSRWIRSPWRRRPGRSATPAVHHGPEPPAGARQGAAARLRFQRFDLEHLFWIGSKSRRHVDGADYSPSSDGRFLLEVAR